MAPGKVTEKGLFEESVWMSVGDQGHPMTKAPSALGCWTVFEEAVHSCLCVLCTFITQRNIHILQWLNLHRRRHLYCVCVCLCVYNVHQGTNETKPSYCKIMFVYYISFVIFCVRMCWFTSKVWV